MSELFRKAQSEWKKKHGAEQENLREEANITAPITGSLDEILQVANKAAEAKKKLLEEDRLGNILDTFSVRYAEYDSAFRTYTTDPSDANKNEITDKYRLFQESMEEVKKNTPVVEFLRQTEFAEYFPQEEDEEEQENLPSEIDNSTKKRFQLRQHLITDLVGIAQSGNQLPIDELITAYYPDINQEVARGRIHSTLPGVRRLLEERGYKVKNIKGKGELAVYVVEKIEKPSPVHEKDNSVHISRLKALSYIVTTKNPVVDEIISLLGKTKGEKRKEQHLTPWQSYIAIQRTMIKLSRRVSKEIANEDETRVQMLLDQHLKDEKLKLDEFKEQVRDLFGYKKLELDKLKTDRSKDNYLDTPLVDDIPFTHRDAFHLAFAMQNYGKEIKHICNRCAIPDSETLEHARSMLGNRLFVDRDKVKMGDAHVLVARHEAVNHFISWRKSFGQEFDSQFCSIQDYLFLQVLDTLLSLETSRVVINGENHSGLEFLMLLGVNPDVKDLIDLEIRRKKALLDTQEVTQIDEPQITLVVNEEPVQLPHVDELHPGENDNYEDEPAHVGRHKVRKQEKQDRLAEEIGIIVDEVLQIPEFNKPANTPTITKHFPSLTQTFFDKNKDHIHESGNRSGFPVYDREAISVLLFLENKKGKGGVNPREIREATKIVKQLLAKKD